MKVDAARVAVTWRMNPTSICDTLSTLFCTGWHLSMELTHLFTAMQLCALHQCMYVGTNVKNSLQRSAIASEFHLSTLHFPKKARRQLLNSSRVRTGWCQTSTTEGWQYATVVRSMYSWATGNGRNCKHDAACQRTRREIPRLLRQLFLRNVVPQV